METGRFEKKQLDNEQGWDRGRGPSERTTGTETGVTRVTKEATETYFDKIPAPNQTQETFD